MADADPRNATPSPPRGNALPPKKPSLPRTLRALNGAAPVAQGGSSRLREKLEQWLHTADPVALEAELRAILTVLPDLSVATLSALALSRPWSMLARHATPSLRGAFGAELARAVDGLARPTTEPNHASRGDDPSVRVAAVADALRAGGLVTDVAPSVVARLVKLAPNSAWLIGPMNRSLASYLDVRGDELASVVPSLLDLRPGDALGLACLRFEPTSSAVLAAAERAAAYVRVTCVEHFLAYSVRREGLPVPRTPFRGIGRALAEHPATAAVARASSERPRVARDGLVVAYLTASEPLAQGVLETWLWMHDRGLDGAGMHVFLDAARREAGRGFET